jgi:hypothetical protein
MDKRTKAVQSAESMLYEKMRSFTNTGEEAITYFKIVLKAFTEGVCKREFGTPEHVSMQKFITACGNIYSTVEGADPGVFHDLCNFGLYHGFSEVIRERRGKGFNVLSHHKMLNDIIVLFRTEEYSDYGQKVIAVFEVYRMKMAEKYPGGKRELDRLLKEHAVQVIDEKNEIFGKSILNIVK